MAKWKLPGFAGQTTVLADGSKVVDGIVETDDKKEPRISRAIRLYYGAVEVKPAPAAPAKKVQ